MSGLFASGGRSDEPWLRLGRLEVGTVIGAAATVIASWVGAAIVPMLPMWFFYTPSLVASGEIWRLATWPLANGISLWSVLSLFFFWYFGTELENAVGRLRMLWLLLGIWASLTVAASIVGPLVGGLGGGGSALVGIGLIEFTLLLLWIAEYPTRPMFFGIPAWALGVVVLAIQLLDVVASRDGTSLLTLLLGLVLVAIVGRRVGLLANYSWIPGGRHPGRSSKRKPKVPRAQARQERRDMSDREQLDALLDKINEHGIQGLTAAERRELGRLRDRLRRP